MSADFRVLVFPCCNEPGLEVVDALRRHPRVTVFGAASTPVATDPAATLLGDRRRTLPNIDEAGFDDALRALCAAEAITHVFATVDAVVAHVAALDLGPTRFVGPAPEVAALVLSKSAVYARVADVVPVPRAATRTPAFAKPDRGSGG